MGGVNGHSLYYSSPLYKFLKLQKITQ
ncbi:hypothetical protein E2C01_004037 [Portunus trituberculatus]|uniref:Uncharacterized protein n=1 Tax=Portunus trituberculatus TaxID=210409 RepID=A0A5B7CQA4_PORTR|nr:hypothetical protein [Portunus trituberculatus]